MSETNTQNVCPFCGGPGYHVRGCGLQSERDKDREEWMDLMEENQSLRERLAESTEELEKAFEACKNGHGMQTECYGCQRDEARAELERERIAVSKYATAARVIALHLKEFCDESLPYDAMIADAARKASSVLSELREAHGAAVIAQSEAVQRMEIAETEFRKAKEWNALCELEIKNLRSCLEDAEEDMSVQGVRMGEAQETIYALKNALRELCEKMEAGISGEDETKRARALLEKLK